MKYAYAAVALAALAMADTALILSDISAIGAATRDLTATLKSGDVLGSLPKASAVTDALNKGTTDANANGPATVADSQSVLAAVNALTPDVKASIDQTLVTIPANAPIAAAASDTLSKLKGSTDTFGAALVAIAPPEIVCSALNVQYSVDLLFSSGLAAYGTQVAVTSPTCTNGAGASATATGSGSASATATPSSSASGSAAPSTSAPTTAVTSTAAPGTSTKTASTIITVSSCAPTVTNCPYSSTVKPTGTGVYTTSPPKFTGAANANRAAGVLVAAGLAAALL